MKWKLLIIFFVLVIILYCYGRFIEPNRLTVTRLDLEIKGHFRTSGRLRAILLSDLHINEFGSREKKLVEEVERLQPDIILITGDFIQTRANPDGAAETILRLQAPFGVWGVIGNIDTTAPDLMALEASLSNAGLTLLSNERRRIEKNHLEFDIVGLNLDPRDEEIQKIFKAQQPGYPEIVLTHWPRLVEKIIPYHPQLILCGHTHGGQVRPPLIGRYVGRLISRTHYDMGLFRILNTWLYVSRGVGMTNHPIRLFCPPEITVLNLRFTSLPFE